MTDVWIVFVSSVCLHITNVHNAFACLCILDAYIIPSNKQFTFMVGAMASWLRHWSHDRRVMGSSLARTVRILWVKILNPTWLHLTVPKFKWTMRGHTPILAAVCTNCNWFQMCADQYMNFETIECVIIDLFSLMFFFTYLLVLKCICTCMFETNKTTIDILRKIG